jgi:hypothetical protein
MRPRFLDLDLLDPESTWLSMSLPLTEKEEAYEATRKLLTQAAALK